jgi:hypothetical protein
MNEFAGGSFDHRLKPVSAMQNPLKRAKRASSALERTLAISRRFESAGMAGAPTMHESTEKCPKPLAKSQSRKGFSPHVQFFALLAASRDTSLRCSHA